MGPLLDSQIVAAQSIDSSRTQTASHSRRVSLDSISARASYDYSRLQRRSICGEQRQSVMGSQRTSLDGPKTQSADDDSHDPLSMLHEDVVLQEFDQLRGGTSNQLEITQLRLVGPLRKMLCPYALPLTPDAYYALQPEKEDCFLSPVFVPVVGLPIPNTTLDSSRASPPPNAVPQCVYLNALGPVRLSVDSFLGEGSTEQMETETLNLPVFQVQTYRLSRTRFAHQIGISRRDINALVGRQTYFIEPRPFAKLILIAEDTLNLIISQDSVYVVRTASREEPPTVFTVNATSRRVKPKLVRTDRAYLYQFVDLLPRLFTDIYQERLHMLSMAYRAADDDVSEAGIDPAVFTNILPPDFELVTLEVYLSYSSSVLALRTRQLLRLGADVAKAVIRRHSRANLLTLSSIRCALDDYTSQTERNTAMLTQILEEDDSERGRGSEVFAPDDVSLLSFRNCEAFNRACRDDGSDTESSSEGEPPQEPQSVQPDRALLVPNDMEQPDVVSDEYSLGSDSSSELRGGPGALAKAIMSEFSQVFEPTTPTTEKTHTHVSSDKSDSTSAGSARHPHITGANWPVPPSTLEDLLESHMFLLDGIRVQQRDLSAQLNVTQQTASLMLDCTRNSLALKDFMMSIGSIGIGVGSVLVGGFGMNIMSGLETLPIAVFWVVFAAIILVSGIIVAVMMILTRRDRIVFEGH